MEQRSEVVWRRSSRCANSACVEVATVDDSYLVRDSKNPHGAVLAFNREEWVAFVAGVTAGEFN